MDNPNERAYIRKRLISAYIQSIPFYAFRVIPIRKRKVVFTTIEGTTGFSCNPKYIALELLRRNKSLPPGERWELVWLLDDTSKTFPEGIKKAKNRLLNRAFHLATARFWVDNSRKQLEARKRRGQTYIQTWHAKLGFKPTGLDRGASFSKIAYLVSKHDSDMVDRWLSNSDWYDRTLKTGSLYEGEVLRTGSPRCDILVKARDDAAVREETRQQLCRRYGIGESVSAVRFMMYAPTYREGNSEVTRTLSSGGRLPDFVRLREALGRRFGGEWHILLRLHPQLAARHVGSCAHGDRLIDISREDDMYEILAGCDAFLTDYSSAAFDAAVARIPVFLFCPDHVEYERGRGRLLWDMRSLPFPLTADDDGLEAAVLSFDTDAYKAEVTLLMEGAGVTEDGHGAERIADILEKLVKGQHPQKDLCIVEPNSSSLNSYK